MPDRDKSRDDWAVDAATLDLIHRVVDEEATPGEIARLQELILRDTSVRVTYETMCLLKRHLEEALTPTDPPAGFADGLLRQMKSRSPEPRHWWRSASPFERRRALYAGWAIAAAVLIVAVLMPLVSREPIAVSPAHVSGAMARPERPIWPDTEEWPVVARASGVRAGARVAVTVRRNGDSFVVEPDAASAPSGVSFRWNRETLELINFSARAQPAASSPGEVVFPPGDVPRGVLFRKLGAGSRAEIEVGFGAGAALRVAVDTN